MTFTQAIRSAFRKYVAFAGRASRSEYWWWALFYFLILCLTNVIVQMAVFHLISSGETDEGAFITAQLVTNILAVFEMIFLLATLLPGLAVTARRLHDMNRSGSWMLLPVGFGLFVAVLFGIDAVCDAVGECAYDPDGPLAVLTGTVAAGIFTLLVIIAPFGFLIWMACKGTPGPNRFGPDPLDFSASSSPSSLP